MLAFKLQVFLYLCTSFLSFVFLNLFNKFVGILEVHAVLNDAINRLQMGVSTILQSCIGKHQVMMFSMHVIRCFKAATMVAT